MLDEARGGPHREFAASDGWLWRFSKRHGIRQLTLQGEKLSADKPAADNFITTFQEFIEDKQTTSKRRRNMVFESELHFL